VSAKKTVGFIAFLLALILFIINRVNASTADNDNDE